MDSSIHQSIHCEYLYFQLFSEAMSGKGQSGASKCTAKKKRKQQQFIKLRKIRKVTSFFEKKKEMKIWTYLLLQSTSSNVLTADHTKKMDLCYFTSSDVLTADLQYQQSDSMMKSVKTSESLPRKSTHRETDDSLQSTQSRYYWKGCCKMEATDIRGITKQIITKITKVKSWARYMSTPWCRLHRNFENLWFRRTMQTLFSHKSTILSHS